jgi:hypothetical protein
VKLAGNRSVYIGDGSPGIRGEVVTCAVVNVTAMQTAPDEHLGARPDACVKDAWLGSIDIGNGSPGVRGGIIACAVAEVTASISITTPYDHFGAGPDGRGGIPRCQRTCGGDGGPSVCGRILSPAVVYIKSIIVATPDKYFVSGPDGREPASRRNRGVAWDGSPDVGNGIKPATIVDIASAARTAPNKHFCSGPDGVVSDAGDGGAEVRTLFPGFRQRQCADWLISGIDEIRGVGAGGHDDATADDAGLASGGKDRCNSTGREIGGGDGRVGKFRTGYRTVRNSGCDVGRAGGIRSAGSHGVADRSKALVRGEHSESVGSVVEPDAKAQIGVNKEIGRDRDHAKCRVAKKGMKQTVRYTDVDDRCGRAAGAARAVVAPEREGSVAVDEGELELSGPGEVGAVYRDPSLVADERRNLCDEVGCGGAKKQGYGKQIEMFNHRCCVSMNNGIAHSNPHGSKSTVDCPGVREKKVGKLYGFQNLLELGVYPISVRKRNRRWKAHGFEKTKTPRVHRGV